MYLIYIINNTPFVQNIGQYVYTMGLIHLSNIFRGKKTNKKTLDQSKQDQMLAFVLSVCLNYCRNNTINVFIMLKV